MKNRILFSILIIAFCSGACNDEKELQKSIYVEDSTNPGLPKYSELGYNTFGAYYDREAFTSSEIVPVKVVVTNGETAFIFNGRKGESNEAALTFKISDFEAQQYSDLISLNGIMLDLTDATHSVFIKNGAIEEQVQIINGMFKFNKVRNVIVDLEQAEIILSGTFEFQALVDGQPITVSDGRFDVGVANDNFYKY